MDILTILFWLLAFIVVYTHVGYGLLLYVVRLRRVFGWEKKSPAADFEPEVTLFITAYNEKDYVDAKMKNTLELDYPRSKLHPLGNRWFDDGTPEKSPQLCRRGSQPPAGRSGKIAAMNQGMQFVKTPIVVFSDANTPAGERIHPADCAFVCR